MVAATKIPYMLHKDIAQQFQIPANLVGRLAKEAEKKPEKLQLRIANENLVELKRDAIEDVASKILASNSSITRIQHVQAAVQFEYGLEVTRSLTRH